MSHTDNTMRKFDENFPAWLALKLWIEQVDPEIRPSGLARRTQKRNWRREIEMELSE